MLSKRCPSPSYTSEQKSYGRSELTVYDYISSLSSRVYKRKQFCDFLFSLDDKVFLNSIFELKPLKLPNVFFFGVHICVSKYFGLGVVSMVQEFRLMILVPCSLLLNITTGMPSTIFAKISKILSTLSMIHLSRL